MLDFELLILPGATLLLTAAVIDPMRGANRLLGRRAYRWQVTTPDGAPAITASGVPIPADGRFAPVSRRPLLIVASYDAPARLDPGLRRRLAGSAAHRPAIGAVEGGVWLLAMSGLLSGRRATTHWEDLDALAEAHPDIEVTPARYVIDGPRFTAAGAAPALDMMIELVRCRQGMATALALARLFEYAPALSAVPDLPPRVAIGEPRVATAIGLMEAHLAAPLSIADLARRAGVSRRHLQALFRDRLGVSPKRHYLTLRLGQAMRLLLETRRSVAAIAAETGFSDPSAFSSAYLRMHGERPAQTRQTRHVRPDTPDQTRQTRLARPDMPTPNRRAAPLSDGHRHCTKPACSPPTG
ncbi:MAG: GlxA family transcriptional regulator [Pseudomonadota bacterium]